MADGAHHKHPFHLVEPSPWPIAGAASAFCMALGAALYFHGSSPLLLMAGFLGVLVTMGLWWRDVIAESVIHHMHSQIVKIGLRYGMVLFIASEVMFFFAFFWAFFDASLFPKEATLIPHGDWETAFPPDVVGTWPPSGMVVFDAFGLPLMNTLILLLSGCTVTWAHHSLLENDRKGLVLGLAASVVLGLLFTTLQAVEYSHAPFKLGDNVYSSAFFIATGFHGFHVIIGTCFLAVCLFRSIKGQFTPEEHVGLEAAAWYWHFVDVVWLFLFCCIYWWGAGSAPIS